MKICLDVINMDILADNVEPKLGTTTQQHHVINIKTKTFEIDFIYH